MFKSIFLTTIITGSFLLNTMNGIGQSSPLAKTITRESIRPFTVHFAEEEISELRKRILATN